MGFHHRSFCVVNQQGVPDLLRVSTTTSLSPPTPTTGTHNQSKRHNLVIAIASAIWYAAGLTWFLWRGWQAVQRPGPYLGPGYLAWLQSVPQLTPLRLGLLAGLLGVGLLLGWLVWRTSRFDRLVVLVSAVTAVGLALLRPRETGWSLLLFVLVTVITASIGRWTLRRLRLTGATLAEELFYSLALGWGWLVLAALVLGFLGLLSPPALVTVLLLLAVVSWRQALAWWQDVRRWRPTLPAGSTRRLLSLAHLPFVGLVLLGALAPATAFDATWYHLYLPKLYLQAGALAYFPAHYRTLWPANVELINLWGLAVGGQPLAQLIGLSLVGGILLGLYAATRRLVGPAAALLATLLFLSAPDVSTYAPSAYVDLPLAFFVFVAGMAWYAWFTTGVRAWLWVGALSVGLAAGTKLLGWPYLVSFVLLTGIVLWRRPLPGRGRTLAFVLLLAAAPSVPWLVRAWVLGGDPLFPFAFRWFQETAWNACTNALHTAHFAYVGVGQVRSVPDLLVVLRLVADYAAGPWLSLGWPLVVVLLLVRYVRGPARALLVLAGIGLGLTLLQAVLFPMPRFFATAQIPGAMVVAAGTVALLARAPRGPRGLLVGLLGLALALCLANAAWVRLDAAAVVLGRQPAGDMLAHGLPEYAAMRWASDNLPADSRVLNWSLRGLYLDRDQVPVDPAFQGLLDFGELRDAASFVDRLRTLGITHLLVLPDASQFYYPQGPAVGAYLDTLLAALAPQLTLLYEQGGTRVYALDTTPEPAPVPLPAIDVCQP